MSRPTRWFLLHAGIAALCLGPVAGRAESSVSVRADVDLDYAAQRAAQTPPPTETVVFIKGRFHPGLVRDRTLERTPFIEIARTVASDLRRQNYVPTRDPKTADLLVVIHWGVTDQVGSYAAANLTNTAALHEQAETISSLKVAEEAAMADLDFQQAQLLSNQRTNEEQTYGNLLNDIVSDLSNTDGGAAGNARLIGLRAGDDGGNPFGSELARTHRSMAIEERYFLIVTAYDFRVLRRTGQPKVLWVTRLSTRSAGINFTTAVNRLSNSGGEVFGHSTDGFSLRRVQPRQGKIEYGELIVIETR